MASHRHTAAAPVTAIERLIKKYSSGMALAKGSMFVAPRIHCSSVPYFRSEGVPSPHSRRAGDRHRKADKKIFVGNGAGKGVNVRRSPHPLQQRAVLLEQQDRYESTW